MDGGFSEHDGQGEQIRSGGLIGHAGEDGGGDIGHDGQEQSLGGGLGQKGGDSGDSEQGHSQYLTGRAR